MQIPPLVSVRPSSLIPQSNLTLHTPSFPTDVTLDNQTTTQRVSALSGFGLSKSYFSAQGLDQSQVHSIEVVTNEIDDFKQTFGLFSFDYANVTTAL